MMKIIKTVMKAVNVRISVHEQEKSFYILVTS